MVNLRAKYIKYEKTQNFQRSAELIIHLEKNFPPKCIKNRESATNEKHFIYSKKTLSNRFN